MEYDNNESQSSLEDESTAVKDYLDELLKGGITVTSGSTFTDNGSLTTGSVFTDSTSDVWIYDGTTTTPITTTTGTWNGTFSYPIEIPKATKDELKKIIKNTEVQIEIDGEMKTAKLSDLLETGYLKLKTL